MRKSKKRKGKNKNCFYYNYYCYVIRYVRFGSKNHTGISERDLDNESGRK